MKRCTVVGQVGRARRMTRMIGGLLGAVLSCGIAQAADGSGAPRWEAGIAAGVGHVPDYPGADRSRTRGIVLPMFIYRGPVLRIDQGGIRGRVLDSPNWEFDFSATGGFNAKDNAARDGMPPIDYLFGLGPQWVYKGLQSQGSGPTLHLKLRAMMSTDMKRIDSRGFSIDPEVRWRLPGVAGTPATLSVSVQPTWASRALHRTFYQVDPSEATAQRPAYRARAGYLGTEVGATLSHRMSRDLSWFVAARGMSLHGAANTDSPLLRERSQLSVGAGVVWTPWRSGASAAD
ncbi:MipA/OmpV family protein [Ideonella sp. A 288]|uniref:MipA/OmpV family protein n=1 Tax=Ideonella sp. A 288 TaxID=1962181 RepID=UPI000B4A5996|nr:MipA/OmpV family protein [Ideonella sp. A 288]